MDKASVRYVFDKDVSHINIWDAPKMVTRRKLISLIK
jgi:hypothetical protein